MACGARDQACCATGRACSGSLACQTGICTYTEPVTSTKRICAEGGTVTTTGATLTIPNGALATCVTVSLAVSADPAPDGYNPYTPVFEVTPAATVLSRPASLTLEMGTVPELATAFWSTGQGDVLAPVPFSVAGGTVTAEISRFGSGFVAGRDYVLVCDAGGSLALPGATLTIPSGALDACTMVKLTQLTGTPTGYTNYSPEFLLEPEDATLAQPATLSLDYTGDVDLATLFWSRVGTTGYERVSGIATAGQLTAQLSRLGKGFVADGVDFVDPPDRSCVVSKVVEGRTTAPSGVALFFTMDDCWGRPLPGLVGTDFVVLENDSPISPAESSATVLQRDGVEVFTSLVIDMSDSTIDLLPAVIDSAKSFVTNLQVTRGLPVQIDIQLFAGDAAPTEWQAPTLDTNLLLSRLDALASYTPTDQSSTDLNGAVVESLIRLSAAEEAFRARNFGGAFTIGYLVLFTDGYDTASRVSHTAAVTAVEASPDQVVAVGLQSAEYDGEALQELAPGGVITAPTSSQLATAFAAIASRMAGQINRFYLLGYCSPKRGGEANTVSLGVQGSENRSTADYTFDAREFAAGCTGATFTGICDARQCGGLGCGACDDRLATCEEASSLCVNNCGAVGMCSGGSITNAQGYTQSCDPIPANTSCGMACVDTTIDSSNCGACGIVCPAGQRCAGGTCVN